MKQKERQKLIDEKDALRLKFKTSDFIDPKDMRRVDAITSLLMSDGETDKLRFGAGKVRESNRVTSFTRDRR